MSITFKQVTYDYSSRDSHSVALDNVSFTVDDGEFLGIIGHTGSGKSTLIQHMNGLLSPTTGQVLVNGEDLAQKAVRRAVRRKVGMAFQYPEYQLFAPTVAEDIAFGPRNLGIKPDEIDTLVREAMRHMDLDYDTYARVSPFELSGGQKRRVAIAGVISCKPDVLVLDEPTAGLDPVGRDELLGYIDSLHKAGMTIVMISHSMEDIARYAERVLVLNRGSIFALGTPEEVFAHSTELRAINLGVPETTAFASELNEAGFDLPENLYTVDALAEAITRELGGDPDGL